MKSLIALFSFFTRILFGDAGALDMTSFAAALKQHYTADRVENMVYKDNPFLAMVPKYEQFGGENLKLPIKYGIPQGRSATFATAQSNKTNTQLKAFLLTRAKDYSLASIDNETIEASKGNPNSFMEAATTEIDGAIESCTRSLAIALYGSGSGSIGQVTTGGTGTSFTLINTEDVTNFEVGQELVFSTADGGGSVKSGSITVTGVNRDSGVITTDAASAIDGSTGHATNDYVFIEGDYDAKVKGLLAWIPSSAPSSTLFFNVDRTADVTRLGGIRYDGSALPIEEALIEGATRAAREGAKPDAAFLAYSKFADLEKSLGSKVQYIDAHAHNRADIGFRGIQIHGPRGPIKVIPDQNCPSSRCFMLSMQYWKLYSLGKAPKLLDSDGLKFLRDSGADSVEVRVGYYAQLGCRAPGYNVNINLG